MKTSSRILVLAGVLLLAFSSGPLRAANKELAIIDSAEEVIDAMAVLSFKAIPPALMQDAQGVAIIPNVIKAGLVIGGRHGRGVMLLREPNGTWSNPIFITLSGGSIGWQIGVQSTDVVLVFKTRSSLDRIIKGKGKLTLGADAAVAAGPVGRQAEADTDGQLKAEIYSYSRSRGLFAGLSLEGAAMLVDAEADEAFYRIPNVRPADILLIRGSPAPAVEKLKCELLKLSAPLAPPPLPPAYAPSVEYPPRLVPTPLPTPPWSPPELHPPTPVPPTPPPPPY